MCVCFIFVLIVFFVFMIVFASLTVFVFVPMCVFLIIAAKITGTYDPAGHLTQLL